MKGSQYEIFGIHRTTLLVIAIAISFGSFSVYKALGGGTSTVGRTERSEVPAISDVHHDPAHANAGTASLRDLVRPTLTNADVSRPAVKTTLTPIEQIQVGDRVLAESPTGEEDTAFGSEIIPSDWRKLTLRAPKRDGTTAEVVLLRPLTWLNEQHGEVGGTVFISVPECGIDGNARVLAIEPCPEFAAGAGRVVTGTFRHRAARTLDLTIAGESQPIGCTGNHPFWSETRQDFVRADSLQPGEILRTPTGLTTVVSASIVPGETFVYNLEVHGAHVYHVGASGVLVHNGNDSCLEIALGLGPESSLVKFSDETGGLWFKEWQKAGLTRFDPNVNAVFDFAFEESAQNARHIHFNLDGFKVMEAINDSADWHLNNFTNMEFKLIIQNDDLLKKTTFYLDGKEWFRGIDILNGGNIPTP